MINKKPLIYHRVRQIDGSFAWISHRFLRQDRMILVDGFKRQRSARQSNMPELLVTPLRKTNCEAKALIYLLNRPASFSIITEANLIRDLVEVEGLNQVR